MLTTAVSGCFTHVIVDGSHAAELADLQLVMQRIQDALRQLPLNQQNYVGNALLTLAVAQLGLNELPHMPNQNLLR